MNKRLVNREIAVKDRMYFLEKSYDTLTLIINSYNQWMLEDDFLETLQSNFKEFLSNLYKTRYFTYISVGGDLENIPDDVEFSEKLFVDLIDTIYAMSKYLSRFINHQSVLRNFKLTVKKDNYKHQRYIEQILETDNNTILRELNTIQMRINMFQKFIKLF